MLDDTVSNNNTQASTDKSKDVADSDVDVDVDQLLIVAFLLNDID